MRSRTAFRGFGDFCLPASTPMYTITTIATTLKHPLVPLLSPFVFPMQKLHPPSSSQLGTLPLTHPLFDLAEYTLTNTHPDSPLDETDIVKRRGFGFGWDELCWFGN